MCVCVCVCVCGQIGQKCFAKHFVILLSNNEFQKQTAENPHRANQNTVIQINLGIHGNARNFQAFLELPDQNSHFWKY